MAIPERPHYEGYEDCCNCGPCFRKRLFERMAGIYPPCVVCGVKAKENSYWDGVLLCMDCAKTSFPKLFEHA